MLISLYRSEKKLYRYMGAQENEVLSIYKKHAPTLIYDIHTNLGGREFNDKTSDFWLH